MHVEVCVFYLQLSQVFCTENSDPTYYHDTSTCQLTSNSLPFISIMILARYFNNLGMKKIPWEQKRISLLFIETVMTKLQSLLAKGYLLSYREIMSHIAEDFWYIEVIHRQPPPRNVSTVFSWKRGRLFDKFTAALLYDTCLERPLATVVEVGGLIAYCMAELFLLVVALWCVLTRIVVYMVFMK